MSIPMLGLEDIVGRRFESCEIDVVEELREEKGVLFAIFPIGATMQDGGKRKRSNVTMITSYKIKIKFTKMSKNKIKSK